MIVGRTGWFAAVWIACTAPAAPAQEAGPGSLRPIAPADGSVHGADRVSLRVAVHDPAAGEVTFHGRRLRTGRGETFTLVALPDTQHYSRAWPAYFEAQTRWIVDRRDEQRIAFVTHLGDIVNNSDRIEQWENADRAIRILDEPPGVPYGIAVGNHDEWPYRDPSGTATYNRFFPVARYEGRPWYGGHFATDNDNHYELFRAGGMDFVIVHIEYSEQPQPDVLAWADGVLKRHHTRHAIVTSHAILQLDPDARFGREGEAIYHALKGNPNLFLMLCGHISGEAMRADRIDGHVIHTLLADYQRRPQGGEGWLRIIEFVPDRRQVRVRTYSPVLHRFETDADSEFAFHYDMAGVGPFAAIGTVAVPGEIGHEVGMDWLGLVPGATYEWYASVRVGGAVIASAVSRFTLAGRAVDFDRDGDVDESDGRWFLSCFTGPNVMSADPRCDEARLDGDGDVDHEDYARFLAQFTGDGIPADSRPRPPG